MPRRSPPVLPSIAALAAAIAADVRRLGGAPRRSLPKVPSAARAALDEALRADGLEVTRNAVRLPCRAQLLALLEGGRTVDEKGLAARLACVAGPEAKALVAELVREARVLRVERMTGPALVLASERTCEDARATRLAEELERALKWVRRSTKSPRNARLGLLDRDVAEVLGRLQGAVPPVADAGPDMPESHATPPTSLLDLLTRTATQLAAQHGGLAPVPMLVRALGASTASVHAALLEGHAKGWLELQPESSMGRLGAEDLALCPPGPEGTRLSWVRLVSGPHSRPTKEAAP